MEDTLKLILNKLETMESSINELKDGQKKLETKVEKLETKVDNLEGKIDNLTKKEEEHFELLFSEQDKIYNSLDKRLSLLET